MYGELGAEALRAAAGAVFVEQVAEALELVSSAGGDEEVLAAAAAVLERIRATALAMEMASVAAAAATALAALTTDERMAALRDLAEACRTVDRLDVLPAVLVLHGPGLVLNEPGAHVFEELEALVADAGVSVPEVIVVPSARLAELARHRGLAPGVPRVAWGEARGLDALLDAARGGASLYFLGPVDLHTLLEAVRLTLRPADPEERVLLVGVPGWMEVRWEAAARGWSASVTFVRGPDEALLVAESEEPTLIVLAEAGAMDLLRALACDPRLSQIPRVVVGRRAPFGMLEWVISPDLDDEALRVQLGAVLERGRRERAGRALDRSGVASRGAFLSALRREVAVARRVRSPACLATLTVSMGERRAAVRPAVAELARAIRENARSTDFVGRIAPDALAVLFASARAETMSEWADAVRASFARRTRAVTLTIDLVDLAAPAVSRERQRPR
jgi:hypothetical protein